MRLGLGLSFASGLIHPPDTGTFSSTLKKTTAAFALKNTNHISEASTLKAMTAAFTVAAFGPLSISGLLLWAKSESLAVGTNATWVDSSGNGQTITCTGSPVGAADAAYGGKTSLTMDGSTTKLATAANMTYGPHTIFIVGKMTGTSTVYFFNRNDGGTLNDYLYGTTGNSSNYTKSAVTSSFNLVGPWGIGTVPRTLVRSFDGTTAGHNLRINGSTQSRNNVTTGVDPGTATTTTKLGIYGTAAGTSLAAGTIGEVLVYNSALSAGNIALVETYLRTKFGHY